MGITEPQVPLPAAAARKKNVFERIAGVLFAPAEAFGEIARRPDIFAPMLIVLALGFAATLLIVPKLDLDAMFEAQSAQIRKQNPDIADADLERIVKWGAASAKMFMYISPLLMALWWALMAAVLLFAFRLLGGEGTFRQALSATIYAWLPMTIAGIITAVVVLARGSFDPTTAATIVKSNPAFLTTPTEQPVLFTLLSSLDLFSAWTLILLTFGFASLSKLPKARAAGIVITLWIMMVLVKVGFAAMSAARMSA
ncbi:MAG TPA: Yip1 family protein [Thermoanaerobaculia bacterium]|jgi:hypothetical protein